MKMKKYLPCPLVPLILANGYSPSNKAAILVTEKFLLCLKMYSVVTTLVFF